MGEEVERGRPTPTLPVREGEEDRRGYKSVCGQPRPAVVRRRGREVARSGGLPAVCLPGARFCAIGETVCTQDEKDLF